MHKVLNISPFVPLVSGRGPRYHAKNLIAQIHFGFIFCSNSPVPRRNSFWQCSIVCVRVVFSGWAGSVGGVSHKQCLHGHLVWKEHIMSMYDWSGSELRDRRAWGDCVKCHPARGIAQMQTVRWHFQGTEHDLWGGEPSSLRSEKLWTASLLGRHGRLIGEIARRRKRNSRDVCSMENANVLMCIVMYPHSNHMLYSVGRLQLFSRNCRMSVKLLYSDLLAWLENFLSHQSLEIQRCYFEHVEKYKDISQHVRSSIVVHLVVSLFYQDPRSSTPCVSSAVTSFDRWGKDKVDTKP